MTFSIDIRYIDVSWEYAGWVRFASGQIIFGRVMPLWLRKIALTFSFRSLSPLQFDIWNDIWYIDLSCEYAGLVRILVLSNNFRQSYAPWQHFALIVSFHSLQLYLHHKLIFWIEIQYIHNSSSNFVLVEKNPAKLFPLHLNSNDFLLPSIISVIHEHFELKFRIYCTFATGIHRWSSDFRFYLNYCQQCYAPCNYVSW